MTKDCKMTDIKKALLKEMAKNQIKLHPFNSCGVIPDFFIHSVPKTFGWNQTSPIKSVDKDEISKV